MESMTQHCVFRTGLVDPMLRITEGNKDLNMKENLATHDTAIKKYKDFKPVVPFQHRWLIDWLNRNLIDWLMFILIDSVTIELLTGVYDVYTIVSYFNSSLFIMRKLIFLVNEGLIS